MRADHPSDPSALAKLLVLMTCIFLASPASAQDAQDTEEPEPPPASAPAEPETAAQEPTAPEAPAEPETASQEPKAPEAPPAPKVGAQAVAFARRFAEVIAHELTVQKYEQESLGAEQISNLGGQRLTFRLRVDRDADEFEARLATVPKKPLEVPRLTQAQRDLSTREKLLVGRLARAYSKSRDLKDLDFLFKGNEKFLATENWTARGTVVRFRDELMAREISYGDLAALGRKILVSAPSQTELDDMEALLDEISPETKVAESSLVQQLLTDPELQIQVLGELKGVLTARYDPQVPEESDEELLTALNTMHEDLLAAAGLTEAHQQLAELEAEIALIDQKLEDMGVSALTLDQQFTAGKHKTELIRARNELQLTWNRTTPPEPQASQLISTQDALIRRRLHDLGAHGALFAHSYDSLDPAAMFAAEAEPSPSEMWAFFDAQANMITSLDEARPAPNPLAGMSFGLVPKPAGGLPAALLGNLPAPKKGKKGKKGGR